MSDVLQKVPGGLPGMQFHTLPALPVLKYLLTEAPDSWDGPQNFLEQFPSLSQPLDRDSVGGAISKLDMGDLQSHIVG